LPPEAVVGNSQHLAQAAALAAMSLRGKKTYIFYHINPHYTYYMGLSANRVP
jgi:hypothetical protein